MPSAVAQPYRPNGTSSGARGSSAGAAAAAPAPAPPGEAGATVATGLFGAVALITGSTIGAGMLALPAVTAPAGIVPTSLSLVACWALLTLDALLLAGGWVLPGVDAVCCEVPAAAAAVRVLCAS